MEPDGHHSKQDLEIQQKLPFLSENSLWEASPACTENFGADRMKSTMHHGSLYVCTNLGCGRTAEFSASPTLFSGPCRCICGSLMKKPYSKPSLRTLSKEEAEARLKDAPEGTGLF